MSTVQKSLPRPSEDGVPVSENDCRGELCQCRVHEGKVDKQKMNNPLSSYRAACRPGTGTGTFFTSHSRGRDHGLVPRLARRRGDEELPRDHAALQGTLWRRDNLPRTQRHRYGQSPLQLRELRPQRRPRRSRDVGVICERHQ